MFNVTLTEKELRIYIQWLKKNRMYKGMNLPLGCLLYTSDAADE